jgi:hypothetical protein
MASAVSPTGQRPTPRRSTIFVRVAVVLVVAALAALLLSRALNITSSTQGRPFHDALGLFSTTIPYGWNVSGGIVPPTGNTIVCSGGCSTTGEYYTFQDHQNGDTNATVTIGVTALNNPYARANFCVPVRLPATFVDGIPASTPQLNPTVPIGAEYDFDSGNAYFVVLIAVGVEPIAFGPGSTPTPIPTVTEPGPTQDQAQGIMDSIRVTDHGLC